MTSDGSGIIALESTNECSGYKTVRVASGLVEIAPNKWFCVLLTNMSKAPVHLLKGMLEAHLTNRPEQILAAVTGLQKTDPKTIDGVQASVDTNIQMTHPKDVETKDD